MDNNLQLLRSSEYDNQIDTIFTEFGNSMVALQTQDIQSSEQSLLKARNAFKVINLNIQTNEIIPFKIMCSLIEVTTRVIKSTFLSFEERYKRSYEELELAKLACDEASANFADIPVEFEEMEEFEGVLPLFKNLFIFYDAIITSTMTSVHSQILIADGKFVDEIKTLKDSVAILRKINSAELEQDPMNLSVPLITMVNKIADSFEKKVERLEEKRKKIEFARPIDKKVFIVHGHNVAILNELSAMLKQALNVTPVILNEMKDKGHTLIEKFEEYARFCALAFVIITPDDIVENKKQKYFQGRANVLFELGWFCGRFGRDKVRILRQKDTQLPSDLNGLVTIDFHEKLEEVFRRINADLEDSGIIEPKVQLIN
ncbi:MAG: TIR domain-containing protein [Flavisolibacter sp.]